MPGQRFVAADHVVSVDHGDRTVLLDAISERYFSLNQSGRMVWSLLCDGASRDEILTALSERFSPSDTIADDVTSILDRLLALNLVKVS